MTRVIVHQWHVRAPLPGPVIDEIHRAHRLRNDLVEIDRTHAERVAEIWGAHPDVAATEAALAEADEAVEAARQAVADAKKAARGAAPRGLRDELTAARAARREAKTAQRAAKDAAYPQVKPAMVAARDERKAAQKALYRAHVDAGLYWASFNAVRDHHETAVKRVAALRKQGRPADLRFHRWTGEGTIAVQLQRAADKPPRTIGVLSDDRSPWRNVARIEGYPDAPDRLERRDWRRIARQGQVHLTFRLGSGEHAQTVTIPVAVDRPVPPDADIVGLQVTRRLVGGKERASVAVTMRVADTPQVTSGRRVAMHLGWRTMGDGSIRVAVVRGAAPPPAHLVDAGVVRDHRDWAEVRVPASWVDLDQRHAAVASRRDQAHHVALAGLCDWLATRPEPPEVPGRGGDPEPLLAHHVRQWRSPSRLAWLTRLWRDTPPDDADDLVVRLEAWCRQDHHLWQWHAHGSDGLAGRRLDAWRKVARWVADGAAVVTVDEWDVPPLVRTPDIADDASHAERIAAESGRRSARLAAPGMLRAQAVRAAGAVGAEVVAADLAGAGHYGCGGELDPEQRRSSHLVDCLACGVTVDQDHNRLLWMTAASGGVAA